MSNLSNAPIFQLLLDHPSTTLVGCLICMLLVLSVGCWWTIRAKRLGKSAGALVMVLCALACTLSAFVVGFVASRELDKQQDFANAKSQYVALDSEREELYEEAMELIAEVDELETQAEKVDPSLTGKAEIRLFLRSVGDLAGDLTRIQEEANQQHTRAKQIRGLYRELSVVVHTGKMLAELDKQSDRLEKIERRLQEPK